MADVIGGHFADQFILGQSAAVDHLGQQSINIGLLALVGMRFVAPIDEPAWLNAKAQLPVMALLHALALAWLVARFVPRNAGWMHRRAASWLAMIGRHSLEVFCLGLFLAWGATQLLRLAPASWSLDFGLTLAGAAILWAWAAWLDGRKPGPVHSVPRTHLAAR